MYIHDVHIGARSYSKLVALVRDAIRVVKDRPTFEGVYNILEAYK